MKDKIYYVASDFNPKSLKGVQSVAGSFLENETVFEVPIRKTLEELLEQLPDAVTDYEKRKVYGISLHKVPEKYSCMMINVQTLEVVERFESTDPANAVAMMIGFLNYKKLM